MKNFIVWSNVAFPLLATATVIVVSIPFPWEGLFVAAMLILGIGSGLWHRWPENKEYNLLDELGMYAVGVTLLGLWIGLPWWTIPILYVAPAPFARKHLDSMVVVPLLIAVVLAAMLGAGNYWAVGSALLFGAAWYFRQRDKDHAHGTWAGGVWHVLTALSACLAFGTFQ